MKTWSIAATALLIMLSSSCTREENNRNAGKGGNAVISAVPQHHGVSKNIISGKMYIKYNAKDAPAAYDDSANCAMIGGVPIATFSGLKTGDYYFYCTGYDTSISQNVKGGLPYSISAETALSITVPVTETH